MQSRFIHFPPIEKHGVVGDRRTAALVAADGTIGWCCLPDYDDHVLFGALLDPERGGHCRFGPVRPALGEQRYEGADVCLLTCWHDAELADLMPWPERDRPEGAEGRRVILRRLRALHGMPRVRFELRPRWTFGQASRATRRDGGARFEIDGHAVGLWTSFALETDDEGAWGEFNLSPGDEAWAMVGLDETPADWTVARCGELHGRTNGYWRDWCAELHPFAQTDDTLRRCAITVHLLAHAPNEAVVAAATTSLPERIGGSRNYDYRYTWVRDASLSAAFLATMGQAREVARYFDWLCDLDSESDAPLQVCYRTNGQTRLEEREVPGVAGYLGSQPVHFGNRAFKQRQLGSLGWFADSALIFLEAGGEWKPKFWQLLRRCAEHVCGAWRKPDSGVWELGVQAHYVESKVMAWVTLDRALRVAQALDEDAPELWGKTREAIREKCSRKAGARANAPSGSAMIPTRSMLRCCSSRS